MKCQICGYEHLDVHETPNAYATYCQQCGGVTEAQRANPTRWAKIHKLPLASKAGRNSQTAIVPLNEKRRKSR